VTVLIRSDADWMAAPVAGGGEPGIKIDSRERGRSACQLAVISSTRCGFQFSPTVRCQAAPTKHASRLTQSASPGSCAATAQRRSDSASECDRSEPRAAPGLNRANDPRERSAPAAANGLAVAGSDPLGLPSPAARCEALFRLGPSRRWSLIATFRWPCGRPTIHIYFAQLDTQVGLKSQAHHVRARGDRSQTRAKFDPLLVDRSFEFLAHAHVQLGSAHDIAFTGRIVVLSLSVSLDD